MKEEATILLQQQQQKRITKNYESRTDTRRILLLRQQLGVI